MTSHGLDWFISFAEQARYFSVRNSTASVGKQYAVTHDLYPPRCHFPERRLFGHNPQLRSQVSNLQHELQRIEAKRLVRLVENKQSCFTCPTYQTLG